MERSGSDQSLLVAELHQIEELVRQLEARMDQPSPIEFCKSLTPKMLSSLDKSINLAKRSNSTCPNSGTQLPCYAIGSPRSETSDQPFNGHGPREMNKKRKTLPKWTSQVKVNPGRGVEGPLDDGYSWRKYGQKDILGAKYPRSYYRCTHRTTRGCLATKQVQRSDDNQSVFDVTYHGTHACHLRPHSVSASESGKQEQQWQQQQQKHQNQDLLQSFQASIKVKTEGLDSEAKDWNSMSSFSSTPVGISVMPDDTILSSSLMPESFSPFLSPATSDSNFLSTSPCQISSCRGLPLRKSESDLTEVISADTSANDSPMADMDFMLDFEQLEFDPIFFQLDASSFFE